MIIFILYGLLSMICLALFLAVIAGGYALHSLLCDLEELEVLKNGTE